MLKLGSTKVALLRGCFFLLGVEGPGVDPPGPVDDPAPAPAPVPLGPAAALPVSGSDIDLEAKGDPWGVDPELPIPPPPALPVPT